MATWLNAGLADGIIKTKNGGSPGGPELWPPRGELVEVAELCIRRAPGGSNAVRKFSRNIFVFTSKIPLQKYQLMQLPLPSKLEANFSRMAGVFLSFAIRTTNIPNCCSPVGGPTSLPSPWNMQAGDMFRLTLQIRSGKRSFFRRDKRFWFYGGALYGAKEVVGYFWPARTGAVIAVYSLLTSWFVEVMTGSPLLLISGPRAEASMLFALLSCLFATRCPLFKSAAPPSSYPRHYFVESICT